MQLSMFSSEGLPAKATASPACELDWMTRVVNSRSPMLPLLADTGPNGWRGRMCPESFQATTDEHLQAFWDCSPAGASSFPPAAGDLRALSRALRAPTASHGACLTLSMCEWTDTAALSLNDAGVCSLSDILATGDVPPRYYLSAKACAGILRRAEARGKALPAPLARALRAVAQTMPNAAD